MAELTINTADIRAAIQKNLEGFTPDVELTQVGRGRVGSPHGQLELAQGEERPRLSPVEVATATQGQGFGGMGPALRLLAGARLQPRERGERHGQLVGLTGVAGQLHRLAVVGGRPRPRARGRLVPCE